MKPSAFCWLQYSSKGQEGLPIHPTGWHLSIQISIISHWRQQGIRLRDLTLETDITGLISRLHSSCLNFKTYIMEGVVSALLTEIWFPLWYLLRIGCHEVQVGWQMWACSMCTGSLLIWFVFSGLSGDQSQQGREERSEEGQSWLWL